jgi:hypothetical protein
MHLKRGPAQLLKLFTGDPASLALVVVVVKTLLAFSPPRSTGVVGAIGHWQHLLGEQLTNNTMDHGQRKQKKGAPSGACGFRSP